MERPVKLLQHLRKRVQSVTYGSPIYKLMLDQGPVPDRLRLSIPDPWPGDAKAGQALIACQPGFFDVPTVAQGSARKRVLAHEWLRDLRAVGTDVARRRAISLIHEWMDEQEGWDEESWAPDVLGARLANWIAFYDFYGPQATQHFHEQLLVCLSRQLRHLIHTGDAPLIGVERIHVIKGLLYGGISLIEGERALGLALELLQRQLEAEILPDGGPVSRQPYRHAEMLRGLIDIRTALTLGQLEIPYALSLVITRMVPVLKFFRHGDGALALFNGGKEGFPLLLDATATLAETRGRVIKRLPYTGYERITAGRSLLLMDVGAPPPRPYDADAHAGLLGFEFSVGRERMIVNCGACPDDDPSWRQAMGATAAHSTITLCDTNACEILPDGGIGQRPRKVDAQRFEQDGVHFVEASHDGYNARGRVVVHRSLALSEDGEELRGRELITGPAGRDYTVRWHLHPSVNALLAQNGQTALVRLPSGAGWRLRLSENVAGELGIESSIYCGQGVPRRTLQLRFSGRTKGDPTLVEWSLKREKNQKGG